MSLEFSTTSVTTSLLLLLLLLALRLCSWLTKPFSGSIWLLKSISYVQMVRPTASADHDVPEEYIRNIKINCCFYTNRKIDILNAPNSFDFLIIRCRNIVYAFMVYSFFELLSGSEASMASSDIKG